MAFEDEIFIEATTIWDVERLYSDLGQTKQLNARRETELTPVEKAILRGLLSNLPPKQIAAALHWTPRALGVELTKGLYRYAETLTGREPNALRNWRDIAIWLEEAGYKAPKQQQDWGQAPDIAQFYGRKEESSQLKQWIVEERYRLVALLGMGGIGKTALTVKLAQSVQDNFDYLIWRNLNHTPPLAELLADLLNFFAQNTEFELPQTTNGRLSRLMEYLREHRCLLIWDSFEAILRVDQSASDYQEEYRDYGKLLKRIANEPHQSCLLLTSQEKPVQLVSLEGNKVDSLELGGLGKAAEEILRTKGLSDMKYWHALVHRYQGNPLALKLVSATIKEVFGGSVAAFFDQGTELGIVVPMFFMQLLQEQFNNLSDVEQQIMFCLATNREPVSLAKLRGALQPKVYSSSLTEALVTLRRRSLIEITSEVNKTAFTLQPMVMKYVIREHHQECEQFLAQRSQESPGES